MESQPIPCHAEHSPSKCVPWEKWHAISPCWLVSKQPAKTCRPNRWATRTTGNSCTQPPPPCFWEEPILPSCIWFCWRENIGHNKKDIAFLQVWDKDSNTERFLALLLCNCVLQPTLVPLCMTYSLLPGPLPIVASASLRLLYSFLYSKHINHIQVLGSLPFPYFSCVSFPLSMWPMSNNVTAFVLGL
jgi:hypothetical protein